MRLIFIAFCIIISNLFTMNAQDSYEIKLDKEKYRRGKKVYLNITSENMNDEYMISIKKIENNQEFYNTNHFFSEPLKIYLDKEIYQLGDYYIDIEIKGVYSDNMAFKIKTWAGKKLPIVILGSAATLTGIILLFKAILGGKKTKGNPPLPGPPLPPGGN